jgi:putative transposase
MARLPRLALADQAHLVLQRALPGQNAFADDGDRRAYLDALAGAARAAPVAVHAYALLEHEVLLLLSPREPAALSLAMQAVGRRYVAAFNRRHARRGTLWDGRFRCAVVEPGPALLDALLYVDGQSERPGLTSAAHRTSGTREPLLRDPPPYWTLGNTPFEREAGYRALLARGLRAETADQLRAAALGGWVYGSAAFAAGLEPAAARPLRPRARGRPRSRIAG